MKVFQRNWVMHPFFFTLFPILSLMSNNLGEVPFTASLRSVFIGEAAAAGLLVLLRVFLKDWYRAGLLTSFAALLFFSFGSAFAALGKWQPLGIVWIFLFMAAFGGIFIFLHRPILGLTRFLNIAGAILLVSCVYGFGCYGVKQLRADLASHEKPVEALLPATGALRTTALPFAGAPAATTVPAPTQTLLASTTVAQPVATVGQAAAVPAPTQTALAAALPDIYYIILDAHARSDVLSEIYDVDNYAFIERLRKRGFYVPEETHSNYGQTALSLSSSLNMNYLDQLIPMETETNDRGPLSQLIADNAVQRFLKERGYRSVAFSNGFPVTEMNSADEMIQADDGLNNFEITLLSESLAGIELDDPILENYRQRIITSKEDLKAMVDGPEAAEGPRFIFAHFILPHPPFVFNKDGSPRASLAGGDGSAYQGEPEEYREGYAEQVQFADAVADELIDTILAHAVRPPVIILQGDHGSGYYLDWESQEESCLRERFSILNAYYLPGIKDASLYESITPVNSFRVILNAYFNAALPLLPDRSFFSTWSHPYDLQEITGQMEDRCGE